MAGGSSGAKKAARLITRNPWTAAIGQPEVPSARPQSAARWQRNFTRSAAGAEGGGGGK